MKDQPSANSLATLMASLSDPVRLRILRLLDHHELSVGEIAKVFQMAQSTASRQLKVLSDASWLAKRSEGTASFYRLIASDLAASSRSLWESLKPQLATLAGHDEDDRRVRGVLEERKTDSVNFFGRVRGEWDQMRAELFGGRFTSAALLSLIRPDWVVADIGCGTGNVAELLSPVVERVVAVDQSEPMLSAARQRLGSRKNLEFVQASIGELPLDSRSVDAAVCMLVLHHIEDVAGGLAEIARVLRTSRGGGVLAVVDMVAHNRDEYRHTMGHRHQGFTKKQMTGLLEKAGFGHTMYHELPAEPDARGPGLFVANGRIR